MRTISLVCRSVVGCILLGSVALACTIDIPPLRKEFRRAESVFVGKVLAVEDNVTPAQIQENVPKSWHDWTVFSTVRFAIGKQWKGREPAERDFVAVAFFDCGCPGLPIEQFDTEKEYLVFSQGDNFVTICDSYESARSKEKIKRLNSFWFRTWARVNPF